MRLGGSPAAAVLQRFLHPAGQFLHGPGLLQEAQRTFRGSASLGAKLSWAPCALARARPSSERLVTQTSNPAARPSWMSAVAMPPVAPWTSTLSPARSPDLVKSAR